MISKKRLKELIKQKATIWSVDWDKIILNENSKICKCYSDFAKNNLVEYCLYALVECDNVYHDMDCDTLYETEEEMNWQLEFGNITRTETLNFPTWEELQNKKEFYLGFNNKEGIVRYYLAIDMPYQKDYGAILISYSDTNNDTVICFDKIATKENYTLACRKAKELFLG